MTAGAGSTIARAADVAGEVLSHPDHADGLQQATLTITDIARPVPSVVRLAGRLDPSGEALDDPGTWATANVAVRIAIDEPGGLPASRVYTVRRLWSDADVTMLELDVVVHDHPSPAMRWLDRIRVGDRVPLTGPRPHVVPATDGCDRALLLADATGIPAVHSLLARWPAGVAARVIAATAEQGSLDELPAVAGVDVERVAPGVGVLLAAAQRAGVGDGTSLWAAGERAEMRALRTWARDVAGLPADRIRVFGYWRRGVSGTELDARRVLHLKGLLDSGRGMADFDDFDIAD